MNNMLYSYPPSPYPKKMKKTEKLIDCTRMDFRQLYYTYRSSINLYKNCKEFAVLSKENVYERLIVILKYTSYECNEYICKILNNPSQELRR